MLETELIFRQGGFIIHDVTTTYLSDRWGTRLETWRTSSEGCRQVFHSKGVEPNYQTLFGKNLGYPCCGAA
jgi:hypothetical protein